ncbi:hypothetical protein F7725_027307 [Dissostichus mawsoni]|uniref:Uncharacterized protein n=1 Tax=Dissostichus mawsoni TaxID=36200 RepID=A0A7J5XDG8_DISMA|nr:hypothetical protein F7725_027307 [Dissostichus mawsoni]
MSHSGAANSFSPSELLLCPSSPTGTLDNSLAKRDGRPSSSFPSTAETNMFFVIIHGRLLGMLESGCRVLEVKLFRCLFSSGFCPTFNLYGLHALLLQGFSSAERFWTVQLRAFRLVSWKTGGSLLSCEEEEEEEEEEAGIDGREKPSRERLSWLSESGNPGRGSVSAHVANMWYGSEAFRTNTNSEPPHVTSFSSRITREDVKSGTWPLISADRMVIGSKPVFSTLNVLFSVKFGSLTLQRLGHLEPQRAALTRRLPRHLQALRRSSAVKNDGVDHRQIIPEEKTQHTCLEE